MASGSSSAIVNMSPNTAQNLITINEAAQPPLKLTKFKYFSWRAQFNAIFLPPSIYQKLELTAFTDAEWADNRDDFTSTSAYVIYLGVTAISWCSKKQKTIERSSTEAEYLLLHVLPRFFGSKTCYKIGISNGSTILREDVREISTETCSKSSPTSIEQQCHAPPDYPSNCYNK